MGIPFLLTGHSLKIRTVNFAFVPFSVLAGEVKAFEQIYFVSRVIYGIYKRWLYLNHAFPLAFFL